MKGNVQWEVQIGTDRYNITAPTRYQAKVAAARKHQKKYPKSYHSVSDILGRLKIRVYKV